MNNLDQFTRAYIQCALWSSTDGDTDTSLYQNYDIGDIAPSELDRIIADCADFQSTNEALLKQAGTAEQNGHDYWLTRNGHGAGFWDRGYSKELGQALTDAAHKSGESDLYVGDDGKVYIFPPDMTDVDSSTLLDCLCGHAELDHQETPCVKCDCKQYRPA